GVPDTSGALRKAIVFKLKPVEGDFNPFEKGIADSVMPAIDLSTTVSQQVQEIRVKQSLFKRRLLEVEKQCRLTGVADLRFLRASHIKPWSKCTSGTERVDGANGLLLTPHADLLFDRGWVTFEDNGALVRSSYLPSDVADRIGLDLANGRRCGVFDDKQKAYLEYHRNAVFETSFKKWTIRSQNFSRRPATEDGSRSELITFAGSCLWKMNPTPFPLQSPDIVPLRLKTPVSCLRRPRVCRKNERPRTSVSRFRLRRFGRLIACGYLSTKPCIVCIWIIEGRRFDLSYRDHFDPVSRLKSNGFSEATNYFFCAAYICLDLRPLHSDLLAKSGGRTSFDRRFQGRGATPTQARLTRFPQIDHRIFRLLPPHSQRILVPIPGE